MTATSLTVMERLKESTQDAHTAAERHPLQAQLVRGQLPQDTYADYLGQLLVAHRALESALRDSASKLPAVETMAKPSRDREPDLIADLKALGRDPDTVAPGAAAASFAEWCRETAETNPVALIGPLYVLEGSTNGGRFIVRAVRKAYSVDGGDRYLDPYGDDQPTHWAAFKTDMASIPFEERDVEALIASADRMFNTIAAIGSELVPASEG
ncbi:MAG: biliverdin-producing heme oxygenase [Planctomycetota bacterium]